MTAIEILFRTRMIQEHLWLEVKSDKELLSMIYDDYRYTLEFRFGEVILHAKGVEHSIDDITDHSFESLLIDKTCKYIQEKFIQISRDV